MRTLRDFLGRWWRLALLVLVLVYLHYFFILRDLLLDRESGIPVKRIASAAVLWVLALARKQLAEAFMETRGTRRVRRFLLASVIAPRKCDVGIVTRLEGLGIIARNIHRDALERGGWVYWPVTITPKREFNNIHAAQCMVLRQLKAAGFRIALYLFDDRRSAYGGDPEDIKRACDKFREDAERSLRATFDARVRTSVLWRRWWPPGRRSQLHQIQEGILRLRSVGDFVSFAAKGGAQADVPRDWPMWHFLDPAMTLAFLIHFYEWRNASGVITVSGADEKQMWERLVDCDRARNLSISHIYIPQLNEPGRAASAGARVEMEGAGRRMVEWKDAQELRDALEQYGFPPQDGDTGNLFDWLVRHFVCVPNLDATECSLGHSRNFSTPEELWHLGDTRDEVANAIVRELSDILIRGG